MSINTKPSGLLVTTKEASDFTGLSAFELRRGWKSGRYPAICVGSGDRGQRLRWNLELLSAAINDEMRKGRGRCEE